MVGRVYNISRLVSSPVGIFFEGDSLLNVDGLNIKGWKLVLDPIKVAAMRNDVYLQITDHAAVKFRFTLTYPGYSKPDFICYSVFDIRKINISDYREVIKDLDFLKFMDMKEGIRNLLVGVSKRFDYIITDVPYLFNSKRHMVYDITDLPFNNTEFPIPVDYPVADELKIDKSLEGKRALILLLYNRWTSFVLYKQLGNAFPLTLIRYPLRKYSEGLGMPVKLNSEA